MGYVPGLTDAVPGLPYCPACGGWQRDGHKDDLFQLLEMWRRRSD